MIFTDFITKWLGKKCDWDGYYGGQCVDLFRQYVQEVLGFPQPKGVAGAKDFWTNYENDPNLKNYYDKIPNTPTGVPTNGDIVLWNEKSGAGYGHVAIFIEGTTTKFTSFDQNWPTLSVCTKTSHTYTNVSGWLHPKVTPHTSDGECRIERDLNWNCFTKVMDALGVAVDPANKEASADTAVKSIIQIKARSDKLTETESQLTTIKGAYETQLSVLTQQCQDKQRVIETLGQPDNEVIAPYIDQLKAKDEQIQGMAEQIKQLQLEKPKQSFWDFISSVFRK